MTIIFYFHSYIKEGGRVVEEGTWLLRKSKKDLSISGHLKETGFSLLTVTL